MILNTNASRDFAIIVTRSSVQDIFPKWFHWT